MGMKPRKKQPLIINLEPHYHDEQDINANWKSVLYKDLVSVYIAVTKVKGYATLEDRLLEITREFGKRIGSKGLVDVFYRVRPDKLLVGIEVVLDFKVTKKNMKKVENAMQATAEKYECVFRNKLFRDGKLIWE